MRKTLGFRLTWYSSLFTLGGLALVTVTYILVVLSLYHRDQGAIHATLAEYADAYRRDGLKTIKEKIAIEKSQTGALPFFIRVAGVDQQTLFLDHPRKWKHFDIDLLTTSQQ
jgi:hypothetical protein